MKKIIALLLVFCLVSPLIFAVDYGIGFLTDFNYQYADWKAVFPLKPLKILKKSGFEGDFIFFYKSFRFNIGLGAFFQLN